MEGGGGVLECVPPQLTAGEAIAHFAAEDVDAGARRQARELDARDDDFRRDENARAHTSNAAPSVGPRAAFSASARATHRRGATP